MGSYRVCPLCKKKPESELSGLKNYWYCPHCLIAWLKKFPKSSYGDTYYKGTSSIFSLLFFPIGRFFYWLRSNYIKKKDIELWIDVGAGEGDFLKTVPAKEKIGVEISEAGRNIMGKNGLKTMSEKEFLKVLDFHADVISFWHVLEHVEDPWTYLRSAYRNLKKGGVVIVGVPNFDSLEFNLFKEHWFHLVPNHHLWHFSQKSIRKILSDERFKITKIDYWSPEHHPTGVLQSFINKTSGSDSILHRLVKRAEDSPSLSFKDAFWSFFWLTVGLPIILIFWIVGSLSRKSGTIVVVASKI